MKRVVLNVTLLLCFFFVAAQTAFQYRRPVGNVPAEDWYAIPFPVDLFQKITKDFSDIRIYSITEKDTTEIPYLVKIRKDEVSIEDFTLPLLNQSRANGIFYFTVQVPAGKVLNTLTLNFPEKNYDARVSIEGSTDRKEWFAIVSNKRIVSIYQDNVDYTNATVHFPDSDYPYLRIQVKTDKQLTLAGASFKYSSTKKGSPISLSDFTSTTTAENKQTNIRITAPYRTAVSTLTIHATHNTDFYRSYSLAYATDSMKTEKGWVQNYSTVKHGYLTSLDSNKITFEALITHELKLSINNGDNPPLTINTIEVTGPQVEIIAKLQPGQNTFLYYGNTRLSAPQYDLVHFEEKIPKSLKSISLLNEENLQAPQHQKALFTQKFWLWTILIVVIGIMGYFTLQMLHRKD